MRGSSYPAAADSFATINEGTTILSANLCNEVAAAVEAIQAVLGVNPSDLSSISATDYGTVAALVLALCRYEIGSFTWPASTATAAVTFTNPSRFTAAPKVFLFPERAGSNNPSGDDTYVIDETSLSTTGFTAVRNISNGSPRTGARNCKYLAIQWPD